MKDKGKGVSATRNEGIDKAKGEFLYFIDSDDILYHTNTLEMARSILINKKHISFVYGDLIVGDSTLTPITYYKTPRFHGEFLTAFLLSGGMIIMLSILFKNHDRIHFNEELCYGEDMDYILRKTKGQTGIYVSSPFGIYRQHSHSLTCQRTLKKAQMIKHVATIYRNFLLDHSDFKNSPEYIRKVMATQYLIVTHMLHRLYYRREAFATLMQALRYLPYSLTRKLLRVIIEFSLPVFMAQSIRSLLTKWKKKKFKKNQKYATLK